MTPDLSELKGRWRVLVGATIGAGAGISMFSTANGFFIKPMEAEFGWSRSLLSAAPAAIFLGALLSPVLGLIIDRVGPRWFVAVGAPLFAACYLALAGIPNQPALYLAILALIGLVAGPAMSPLAFTRVIAASFDRTRALALSIAMTGGPVLSMVVHPTMQAVIASAGWRTGFLALAAFVAVFGALAFVLLPTRPGPAPVAAATAGPKPGDDASFRTAVKDMRFWLLGGSMVFCGFATGAYAGQLVPMLTDKGAASVVALISVWSGVVVVIGRLCVGWILDRSTRVAAIAAMALLLPGVGFLLFLPDLPPIWLLLLATTFVAFGTGAETDIFPFLASRLFGVQSMGAIVGTLSMGFGLAIALGAYFAGAAYDATKSYDLPLQLAAVSSLLAAGAILACRARDRWVEAVPRQA